MKHRRQMSIGIAALMALATSAAIAQSGTTTTTPPTPAQQAAKLVTRLTALLDLTSAEQASATTIFTTEFTSLQTIKTSLQSARTTLETDVKSDNAAGISTDSETIGGLTQQAVEAKATADAAFYALLTSAQQTKLDSLKHLGMGFGGRGGRESGGFGAH